MSACRPGPMLTDRRACAAQVGCFCDGAPDWRLGRRSNASVKLWHRPPSAPWAFGPFRFRPLFLALHREPARRPSVDPAIGQCSHDSPGCLARRWGCRWLCRNRQIPGPWAGSANALSLSLVVPTMGRRTRPARMMPWRISIDSLLRCWESRQRCSRCA